MQSERKDVSFFHNAEVTENRGEKPGYSFLLCGLFILQIIDQVIDLDKVNLVSMGVDWARYHSGDSHEKYLRL